MIIDRILDRKHGKVYVARDFYYYILDYMDGFDYIRQALDYGTELDVIDALCKYIDENEYNPEIKDYIRSVRWLEDSFHIELTPKGDDGYQGPKDRTTWTNRLDPGEPVYVEKYQKSTDCYLCWTYESNRRGYCSRALFIPRCDMDKFTVRVRGL